MIGQYFVAKTSPLIKRAKPNKTPKTEKITFNIILVLIIFYFLHVTLIASISPVTLLQVTDCESILP